MLWWAIITLALASPFILGYIGQKLHSIIFNQKPTTITGAGIPTKRKINHISQHIATKAGTMKADQKVRKPRKPRVKKVNGKVQITWRSIYEEDEE